MLLFMKCFHKSLNVCSVPISQFSSLGTPFTLMPCLLWVCSTLTSHSTLLLTDILHVPCCIFSNLFVQWSLGVFFKNFFPMIHPLIFHLLFSLIYGLVCQVTFFIKLFCNSFSDIFPVRSYIFLLIFCFIFVLFIF